MRLDRVLANLNYGSRNDIKEMCKDKRIMVNGNIITDSSRQVFEKDEIKVDGKIVFHKDLFLLMLNKPDGFICANKDNLHKTVIDLIKEPYNRYELNICGRLDIDTHGLVLITNSGKLMHKIISPNSNIDKTYYVEYTGNINKTALESQMELLDGNNELYTTKGAKVEILGDNKCNITISEGKFHQVKRMFEHINCKVTYLKRIRIGNIVLDDNLKEGDYIEIDYNLLMC
ncbi:MAG: rRNA pseudouridine synthase [Acholeplasmatales bacterium]|nr:rRNA pseudouridine synthase [Acholeplasmatales bacterium]